MLTALLIVCCLVAGVVLGVVLMTLYIVYIFWEMMK